MLNYLNSFSNSGNLWVLINFLQPEAYYYDESNFLEDDDDEPDDECDDDYSTRTCKRRRKAPKGFKPAVKIPYVRISFC